MTKSEKTIQEQLAELEAIASWFEQHNDFDVEEGLKKVKDGATLVKQLKARLREVENEFKEIEADFTEDADTTKQGAE